MNHELKLLVEWSSPWKEFLTSLRPAMARSPKALAGEAPVGLFPYRGILASWVLEGALLMLVILVSGKLASMRPYEPPALPKYDVIYFSGDELPQTEDASGAQAGRSGRAGGREAHHRTQTIRVARGESLREKVVDAPKLHLPQSDSAVANLMAYKPVPGPAPLEGLQSSSRIPVITEKAIPPSQDVRNDKTRAVPSLNANIVPPTPEAQREKMRSTLPMNAAVVPPSPSAPQRDITSMRAPGSQAVTVVPPPVSAPEQITNSNPRLTLPAPSVVAPPPSQIARDIKPTGPGFGANELQTQVVPPPAAMASNTADRRALSGMGSASVVPPPVQLNGATTGSRAISGVGNASVVPPPEQIGGGSLQRTSVAGLGGTTAVVPPPAATSGSSLSGMGRGNRGAGLGGPMDVGSPVAPPSTAGGSGNGTGIVVSSQPGSKIAVPGNAGAGSLAMSPAGGDKPGIGGSGGGSSIGHGAGPGSGLSGEGSGAAKTAKDDAGHGSETIAHGGISPYPGPGGAGSGTASKPPMPGVSVHGGSNIVTLPSFGADGSGPNIVGHSSLGKNSPAPSITVVGSSRSGGAFNFYGALKGDKVYTIYIDTILGTAVMEYADPSSATHPYADDLIAPQPMRADLPANLTPSRLVIACILDRSGSLRNPQVLEPGRGDLTAKVLAALTSWKFRPVFRGDEPVEVNAILGFAIDTR